MPLRFLYCDFITLYRATAPGYPFQSFLNPRLREPQSTIKKGFPLLSLARFKTASISKHILIFEIQKK